MFNFSIKIAIDTVKLDQQCHLESLHDMFRKIFVGDLETMKNEKILGHHESR
jgi:hypothetical protein